MISFKVNPTSLKALETAISRRVAEVTARAASVAYNTAIGNTKPVWSGTFRASWDISWGSPSNERLEHPTNTGGKPSVYHVRPYEQSALPQYSAPFTAAYVSNTADHAYKVEYEGTKTHPDGGWHIALHAKNQTLQRFRLF